MRGRIGWPSVALALMTIATLAAGGVGTAPAAAQRQGSVPPDVYEPDDAPGQAHPLLLVGIPQRRSFHSPNDEDWAYIVAEAGERLVLFTTGACDTYLSLYAPNGQTLLAQDDDSGAGSNAALRIGVPFTGDYFVRVRLFNASAGPCEEYELVGQVLPPPAADSFEPDNTPDQAKLLPADGSPQERSLNLPGDQDWMRLQLPGTTGIRLLTEGACDTFLTLYGPDGSTILAEDDDGGQFGGSQIIYTVFDAGTYYARVRHFEEQAAVCDAYAISLRLTAPTLRDAYEPDDAPAQAKPLALTGVAQTHSVHLPGDNDWVSFTLALNDRVFLFTEGQCDTYLYLYGPDGRTVLAEDDDSGEGTNAAIFLRAPEAGTYLARVRLFGEQAQTCSSYDLTGARISSGGSPTAGPARTPTTPTAGPTAQPGAATASPTAKPPTLGPTPVPGRPTATRSTR